MVKISKKVIVVVTVLLSLVSIIVVYGSARKISDSDVKGWQKDPKVLLTHYENALKELYNSDGKDQQTVKNLYTILKDGFTCYTLPTQTNFFKSYKQWDCKTTGKMKKISIKTTSKNSKSAKITVIVAYEKTGNHKVTYTLKKKKKLWYVSGYKSAQEVNNGGA